MAPKEKPDFLRGTLDLLILEVVALGAVHGYGISERIRLISRGVLKVYQRSLFSALHRLEKHGWLEAEWGTSESGRPARLYRLSAKGQSQMAIEEASWNRLAGAVTHIVRAAHQEAQMVPSADQYVNDILANSS